VAFIQDNWVVLVLFSHSWKTARFTEQLLEPVSYVDWFSNFDFNFKVEGAKHSPATPKLQVLVQLLSVAKGLHPPVVPWQTCDWTFIP
jgi:hypothetical protein